MHQSTTLSLSQTIWPGWVSRQFFTVPIVQTLLPVTFVYSLSSEALVLRQLRRWKRLWRRSLTRSHKRTSIGPSRSCWNGATSALQPEEITSKRTRVSCVSIKVPIRKSLETYLMILLCMCVCAHTHTHTHTHIYIYIYIIVTPLSFNKYLLIVNGELFLFLSCQHPGNFLQKTTPAVRRSFG